MRWWDLLGRALEGVGMEGHRYDCCFPLYEFENYNLNILLVVCKQYKSSRFENLLANFRFTNDFLQGVVLREVVMMQFS